MRTSQLNKVLGRLVQTEGLNSWRESPQVDEQVWFNGASPVRPKSARLLSPNYRPVKANLSSPKDLNHELYAIKRKNIELTEKEVQLEARQKALQIQFEQLKKTKAAIEEEKETWKQQQIKSLKAKFKVKAIGAKILSASPRRAERREIEILREENVRLVEELKTKETRGRLVTEKLNKTIVKLQGRLDELRRVRPKTPCEAACVQTEEQETASMMGFQFDLRPSPLTADSIIDNLPSELGLDSFDKAAPGTAKKTVYPNGYTVYQFSNNDIKRVFPDGSIAYFSEATHTLQTITPEGIKVTRFPNGQVEKTYSDESIKVTFPDGTVKWISSEGETETVYTDGLKVKRGIDGRKVVVHPSGILLDDFKALGSLSKASL